MIIKKEDQLKMKVVKAKVMNRYENFKKRFKYLGVIGKGAYGSVCCYEEISTQRLVAVKQFYMKSDENCGIPITLCREINLLKELEHENVLKVQDVVIHHDGSFKMILDYCKLDLEKVIACHKMFPLDRRMIKSIMFQILKGIEYIQSRWIMHRDLKPSNILINDDSSSERGGVVKIADFGLARIFQSPCQELSQDGPVVTIWYRAPEIMMGAENYTPAIDMWSVGCIMYELFETKPLFRAQEVKATSEDKDPFQKHQLAKIFSVLGKPNSKVWPNIEQLPHCQHLASFRETPNVLEKLFRMPKDSLEYDLLSRLLDYNPETRITAEQALQHNYFAGEISNK